MKKNNKGFTLAELLIVVAIIAVLVAIAIPVFTTQLEKSREATDLANIRSAYAVITTKFMEDGRENALSVSVRQKQAEWQNNAGYLDIMSEGGTSQIKVFAKTSGSYTVKINSAGIVSVE